MAKRDLRRKLLGHFLEGGGEMTERDVNRPVRCDLCGGPLLLRSNSMTGETMEECKNCGASRAVRRFQPLPDE